MQRKELQDLLELTDEQLAGYVVLTSHQQENLISQVENAVLDLQERDADLIALQESTAAQIASLSVQHTQAVADATSAADAVIAEQAQTIVDLRAQIAALGGTSLALQLKKERDLTDALAEKQRIEQKIAEIEAVEIPVQAEGLSLAAAPPDPEKPGVLGNIINTITGPYTT